MGNFYQACIAFSSIDIWLNLLEFLLCQLLSLSKQIICYFAHIKRMHALEIEHKFCK